MHLELLVEEPSVKAALFHLLPRIIAPETTFEIHEHEGKDDLLGKLPARLRGYRPWLPEDMRIVVLIDEDRQDCRGLKTDLEGIALRAGFGTVSTPGPGKTAEVLNRIAVEELEAWFFGDVMALREAYPRIPATLEKQEKFRDPDAIPGGTWEALERVLQKAGYYRAGLPKIEAARRISAFMEPARNRSKSFRAFCDGLRRLCGGAGP